MLHAIEARLQKKLSPKAYTTIRRMVLMAAGSGFFALTKIFLVYLNELFGLAPAWITYFFLTVALTAAGWVYHNRVTFNTRMTSYNFSKFLNTSIGFILFDYFGFLILTYGSHIYPVVSALIISCIQFVVRFITYSAYVFADQEEVVDQRGASLTNLLLASAVLLSIANYMQKVDDARPHSDGRQYYCMAANIYQFGVVSLDCDTRISDPDEQPPVAFKREPGFPAILAPTFWLAPNGKDARICHRSDEDWCKELRTNQRRLLLLPYLALTLLVFFVALDISKNRLLAVVATFFTVFGNGLMTNSVAFLTTTQAAFLLLLTGWMLYRLMRGVHPLISGCIGGVALGLLALTSAVYLYFIPALAVLAGLIYIIDRRNVEFAKGGLATVIIASLLCAPWLYRNHNHFDKLSISGRDSTILSIRASFTEMNWSQYFVGYLAFTPVISQRLINTLGVSDSDAAMFDRDNYDGFYRRGKSPRGPERALSPDERKKKAVSTILKNWPMQIALIPLTTYRGMFMPVGFYQHVETNAVGKYTQGIFRLLAILAALPMVPALFFNTIVDLWNRRFHMLAFHLPALYTIGIHAVATHYIPRYSLPMFALLSVELALAVWLIIGWRKRRKAESGN